MVAYPSDRTLSSWARSRAGWAIVYGVPSGRLIYGVDADEAYPEVPQLVEETVELSLVGEVPGERGLAGPRVNFKVIEHAGEVFAEPPADDDLVPHVVADLLFHGLHHRARPDERSPPCEPVHPG